VKVAYWWPSAPTVRRGLLVDPLPAVEPFGTGHSILLSIVRAGLGMTAVRQPIAVNADLHAMRAELADLAVAEERERLSRESYTICSAARCP
jgi:hypothetical protein